MVGFSTLLIGVFFITRGINPHVSELAFSEHSALASGSIVPASGESYPIYGYPIYWEPVDPIPIYYYPPAPTYTYPTYDYGNSYPTYDYGNSYPSYGNSYPGYETYGNSYPGYETYPSYPAYSAPATISTFSITPRSVERGGLVSISWSIYHPQNVLTGPASCKISAAVQKPAVCDAACTSARNTASSTLNTALSSGNTNTNDPNGSRSMSTALNRSVASPTGYAKGVKSVNLEYSTTFTISCGTTTSPFKSIIYVTDRVEG